MTAIFGLFFLEHRLNRFDRFTQIFSDFFRFFYEKTDLKTDFMPSVLRFFIIPRIAEIMNYQFAKY